MKKLKDILNEASSDALHRMDALVQLSDINNLKKILQSIKKDLIDENFDIDDIQDYITQKINKLMNFK